MMKNLSEIRKRYLKEPFDRKLGHLASNLARVAAFTENSMNLRAVEDILEESKFFIEWTAPEAPSHVQALLSRMQSRLALWQLHLLQQKETVIEVEQLKVATKNWSERLIGISGLSAA